MKQDMQKYWNERYTRDFCEVDITPSDFVKRTIERIKNRAIKDILDLGCGAGRDTLYFSQRDYNLTALDLSEKALSLFQKKPENVKFICGDMQNTPLPENAFDMAFANLTLHYFDDDTTKKLIEKITHALRKTAY